MAEAVPAEYRERAIAECIARTVSIPEGLWSGAHTPTSGDDIGLLMLDGLLIRRVGIDQGFGAELLGEGDLLRPWQGADEPPTLPQTTGWRVLQPTRMAVLDEAFARRMARYPQLSGRLVGRALARSRNLSVNMAIVHQSRVDVRLHMLFWHLSELSGSRCAAGRHPLARPYRSLIAPSTRSRCLIVAPIAVEVPGESSRNRRRAGRRP